MHHQTVVEVEHCTKQFKDFTAVDDLSFKVYQSDIYGFLGQNGAGKSTTMRMLLSLIKPTSGSIKIFGKDIKQNNIAVLQKTGALIEKPDLYKYLSAYDNLYIFARLHHISANKKLLLQQLEMVGLAQRAFDKVGTFSQGMKQRLGIAIALIHNPDLVVLDEPSNGLDPQGIADIRILIKSLSVDHKKTVIVSSHLLNEIEQIATRILIVDQGKKIIEGTTSSLINPSNTLVEIETDNIDKTLQFLSGSSFGSKIIVHNNKVQVTMAKNEIPALNKLLVEQNINIFSIHQRNSLEDYFLKVTKHE